MATATSIASPRTSGAATLLLLAAAAYAQPTLNIKEGGLTYRSHCAPCHGLEGAGGRGPALNTGRFHHATTDEELLRVISNGIPGTEMPGQFYEEDKLRHVVAYLRSLSSHTPPKGDPARGKALYAKLACSQCHRIAGQGGRLGPDLTEIGRSRAPAHLRAAITDPDADVRQRYWTVRFNDAQGRQHEGLLMNEDTYSVQFMDITERLHSVSKSGLSNYRVEKVSKMPSYKSQLSPAELDDLVAYLASLRPQGDAR